MNCQTILIALATCVAFHAVNSTTTLSSDEQTTLLNLINGERQTLGGSNMKTVCWDASLESAISTAATICRNNHYEATQGIVIKAEASGADPIQNAWEIVMASKDTANPTMPTCNIETFCATYKHFIYHKVDSIACAKNTCGSQSKTYLFCLFKNEQVFGMNEAAFAEGEICSGCPTPAPDGCKYNLCLNPTCDAPVIETTTPTTTTSSTLAPKTPAFTEMEGDAASYTNRKKNDDQRLKAFLRVMYSSGTTRTANLILCLSTFATAVFSF